MTARNLVFITIDAWRADFVDSYDGTPLTPILDRYAKHTARFTHAYANTPWTTPAMISMFTGQSPSEHQVLFDWSIPRPDGPAVAARFAQAGYRTPNICYLNRLDSYQNLGYLASEAPGPPEGPFDRHLEQAIRNGSEPYFLWLHYKYVHQPYWPAARYRRLLGLDDASIPQRLRETVCSLFACPRTQCHVEPEDAELIRRLYAANVRQMNDWLATIFEALEDSAAMDHTTVVLSSDHGEELMDHGFIGHSSTSELAHLYEEVLRIPLLVIDKRLQGGHSVDARVQGIDLFPTLLSLAGVDPGSHGALDLSAAALDPNAAKLLPREREFYFHSSRMGCPTPRELAHQFVDGVSDGRFKYIEEHYDTTRRELYDLSIDPNETRPIADSTLLETWAKRLAKHRVI